MAFRNIVIENTAHISIKNRQLIIRTDSEHSVPVEDISALLLENKYSTITTAALSCLGQCGCAVFTCDDKHMPCAVLEPFSQHSRQLKTVKNQIAATEPFKKRVWQSLIISKIRNQAKCLELNNQKDDSDILYNMSLNVKSGDTENVDAVEKHRARVKRNLPENGSVRMLVITEKQYESIDILLGKLTQADDSFQCEQLSIF